ncbi:hypothetical protein HPB52_007927 [Rhipicephalus sanguineus]|uniref:Uncharacterized protein n=1 Tax=Rhipicephalus sanguineus TaxID=34632 RepID=A0A9D4SSR5_RHISA|nr:hypothetical protein HPB52_007927 [Rhipicephalus sanguineus]
MECVEGQEVSPEELSDGSWQSPGLRAQEKRRAAAAKTTPTTMPASPPSKQTTNLQDLLPTSRDTVRIHPFNNIFTLSVADSACAQAYLRITSLMVSGTTFTVHLYAPPPDDALRGILYHAFDDFTDEAILEDLQATLNASIAMHSAPTPEDSPSGEWLLVTATRRRCTDP